MTEPPTPPGLGGHRLIREIGRGATGEVHLAQPPEGGPLVALKLVRLPPPETRAPAISQFEAAAAAASRLVHPGIIRVFQYGSESEWAWHTMELVSGTDLARYTTPARLLPEVLVLRTAARLAEALAHAHRQGVVHRDVKPANVLINWAADDVKLADFGLARGAWATNTGTGIVPGSPAYMAPEQLAGRIAGAEADLYALGVTLYELLTGRRPHDATRMGELLRQVAQEAAPSLLITRPGLPAQLDDLVARLLRKSPTERPSDGEAVAARLREIAAAMQTAV